jgi:hypothetical protein
MTTRTVFTSALILGIVWVVGACGSGSAGNTSDGGGSGGATGTGGTSGGSGGASGTGGVGAACTSCQAGQGCLRIEVTRGADVSRASWNVWPNEVDGVGALIIADSGGGSAVRMVVADADMKPAAALYSIDFGCATAGTHTISVFLDDNGNAAATATSSSDYRDSCGRPRTVATTVTTGQTATVTFPIVASCD